MKKIFKIIIIVLAFFALSVFILRNEFKPVANKIYSYLNLNKDTDTQLVISEKMQLPSITETPGPLRIINDFWDNKSYIKLYKDNIIQLTNKAREENGKLPALSENQKLDLSAEKKLQDMFDKQYFEHISPSGVGVANLGTEVGYEYILIGENLALGNFEGDQDLLDAWMDSPGHRANILNNHYTEIGVAVGMGKYEGKDIWIAVQHFGTPKNICPEVDQVLYGVIDINRVKIKGMETDLAIRKDMIEKGVIYEGKTTSEQITFYNNLINIYNNLILDTKKKVDNYNEQINKFNLCLSSNQ